MNVFFKRICLIGNEHNMSSERIESLEQEVRKLKEERDTYKQAMTPSSRRHSPLNEFPSDNSPKGRSRSRHSSSGNNYYGQYYDDYNYPDYEEDDYYYDNRRYSAPKHYKKVDFYQDDVDTQDSFSLSTLLLSLCKL